MGDLCSHCGSGLHDTEDCTARVPATANSVVFTRGGGGAPPEELPDGPWKDAQEQQLTIENLERKVKELQALHAPGAIDAPPSHYAGDGLDVFDIVDAFHLDFFEGNAVKYILRWRKKHGMDDLLKARHYLDEVIARAAQGEKDGS